MSNPTAIAEAVLGSDFLGPKSYLATFGQLPADAPTLHLTEKEIHRIRDRGEQLVLMLPNLGGEALTMKDIYTRKPLQQDRRSRLLFDTSEYRNESFFTTEVPKAGWHIVSRTPIGLGCDYQGQTDELVAYIEDVYREPNMLPACIEDAIAVYDRKQGSIKQEADWRKRTSSLTSLGINQLLRGSAVETLLHLVLYNTGTTRAEENLLYNQWSWTNSRASDGNLVLAGGFGSSGAGVGGLEPGRALSGLGVLPSRSVGL